MIHLANILADETDDGFTGHLIGLVFLVVLGILSAILKHRQRKQQEKEIQERRERSAQIHHAVPTTRTPVARASAGPPPPQPQTKKSPYEQRRQPSPPPPPPPVPARSAREAIAQAIRQQSLLEELEPLEPAPVEQTNVEEELRRQRQRQARLKQLRRRRLAAARPKEADTADIEKRVLHVAKAPPDRIGEAPHSYHIDLSDRRRALGAILAHEILSQPKALRPDPEMWDL